MKKKNQREIKNCQKNKRYFQFAPLLQHAKKKKNKKKLDIKTAKHEVQSTNLLLKHVFSAGLRKKIKSVDLKSNKYIQKQADEQWIGNEMVKSSDYRPTHQPTTPDQVSFPWLVTGWTEQERRVTGRHKQAG